MTTFGEQVRRARERKGWTQLELTMKSGVGHVATIETAPGYVPSGKTQVKLADALEVSLDWLNGRSNVQNIRR